jgi:hypothetical protein
LLLPPTTSAIITNTPIARIPAPANRIVRFGRTSRSAGSSSVTGGGS